MRLFAARVFTRAPSPSTSTTGSPHPSTATLHLRSGSRCPRSSSMARQRDSRRSTSRADWRSAAACSTASRAARRVHSSMARSAGAALLRGLRPLDDQAFLRALPERVELRAQRAWVDERMRIGGGALRQQRALLHHSGGERMRREMHLQGLRAARCELLESVDAADVELDLARVLDRIQPEAADGDGAIGARAVVHVVHVRGRAERVAGGLEQRHRAPAERPAVAVLCLLYTSDAADE